ncbi:hypothetical protein F4780DRAFT_40753 [Xylariomycetidae sp. FL0641]|nr:hypothetical protein F4780DRAFT_40753 [Xylariomycetidae sp. FL0641]
MNAVGQVSRSGGSDHRLPCPACCTALMSRSRRLFYMPVHMHQSGPGNVPVSEPHNAAVQCQLGFPSGVTAILAYLVATATGPVWLDPFSLFHMTPTYVPYLMIPTYLPLRDLPLSYFFFFFFSVGGSRENRHGFGRAGRTPPQWRRGAPD